MRHLMLCSIAAVAVSASSLACAQFFEADRQTRETEIVSGPARYDRAARDAEPEVAAEATCSTTKLRGIDVTIHWNVTRENLEAYRIDISELRDGFATGRYLTSGPLALAERTIAFEKARSGVYYYWRLLSKTPEGWIVRGNGRFEAPICPVDETTE